MDEKFPLSNMKKSRWHLKVEQGLEEFPSIAFHPHLIILQPSISNNIVQTTSEL